MGLQIDYPPTPLFLKSGDSRGVKGAASCLESISLKPKDSKEVGQGARFEDDCADNISSSNTSIRLGSKGNLTGGN